MPMRPGYSRLRSILQHQALTPADLVRRVSDQGDRVNAKSLYRLSDPQEPLEKVDMRVVGAVCQALGVAISDILTFEEPVLIETLGPARQARMDALASRRSHRGGDDLTASELVELERLIGEAEALSRGNAHRLAQHGRLLREIAKRSGGAEAPPPQ